MAEVMAAADTAAEAMVAATEVEATVVGVVGNVKQLTLSKADEPQLYTAKAQSGGIFHSIAARTAGDPDAMADAVKQAIWAVDRDQPVWKIRFR